MCVRIWGTYEYAHFALMRQRCIPGEVVNKRHIERYRFPGIIVDGENESYASLRGRPQEKPWTSAEPGVGAEGTNARTMAQNRTETEAKQRMPRINHRDVNAVPITASNCTGENQLNYRELKPSEIKQWNLTGYKREIDSQKNIEISRTTRAMLNLNRKCIFCDMDFIYRGRWH